MKQQNKQIDTLGASESGEQTFTFPHTPHPIVVKAKNIKEAEEKFKLIIKTN